MDEKTGVKRRVRDNLRVVQSQLLQLIGTRELRDSFGARLNVYGPPTQY
ncbi:hypothetical protein OA416_00670 [Paracoccaceae bacterium]|nr:hypothetical protein [Paracoccaceae bacterium]